MSSEEEKTATKTSPKKSTPEFNYTDYGSIVGKIAGMMRQEGSLSKGDIAELRRVSPNEPFTPALWRVLMILDLDESPPYINQEIWERRWATLMMGMAYCADLHNYKVSLGRALAEAGWSELRFVQLMRANGEILEAYLRRVAQFLSSKNQEANWTDLAWLLFAQSGGTAEKVRLNISRNYYSAIYQKENN